MKNTLKIAASAALAVAALAATAIPTKRQLAEAQQIVKDLTADDIRALKSKQKTPGEVAGKHLDLAAKADTEAGKYLLLQGAFRLYARSGDYDAAADVLQRMKKEISDFPPEVIVELVDGEMSRVAYSKAPKVHAIYSEAKHTIKYRKLLAAAEADVEKHPTSKTLKQLAECHVHLGDWKKALEAFSRARVPAAKWELDQKSVSDCDAFKAAEYWWNYEAEEAEPFRAHAAALYRIALDEGLVTGLRREVIEKRIRDMGFTIDNGWVIPKDFSAPLEKSLKLADRVEMTFCACPSGSFNMGSSVIGKKRGRHKVNITRPFWMSKLYLTARQYRVFRKDEEACETLKQLEKEFPEEPVFSVLSYDEAAEYLAYLNKKHGGCLPAGYVFRLPTEAEMKYVDAFSGESVFDAGRINAEALSKKNLNPDDFKGFIVMDTASRKAGAWGVFGGTLYTGSIGKLTADSADNNSALKYADEETDPIRTGGKILVLLNRAATYLRTGAYPGTVRIVIAPDLLAEKKAAEKK